MLCLGRSNWERCQNDVDDYVPELMPWFEHVEGQMRRREVQLAHKGCGDVPEELQDALHIGVNERSQTLSWQPNFSSMLWGEPKNVAHFQCVSSTLNPRLWREFLECTTVPSCRSLSTEIRSRYLEFLVNDVTFGAVSEWTGV